MIYTYSFLHIIIYLVNNNNGDMMNNEISIVMFRTILVLTVLFFLTKCMGKKQVSQMNIYDYLIGITIGSIAADISLDIQKSLTAGIVSLIIIGLSAILVTYLTLKSIRFRKIFIGVPTILIEKGKIIEKNLYKEGIDINDLQEEARQFGYFDLKKVNYAILETNGKISFLAKSEEETLTRKDMNIKIKDSTLCANIIIDGTLLENNLNNINKDKDWLDRELKKKGYDNYRNILLLTIDSNHKINIYDKNITSSTKIFE